MPDNPINLAASTWLARLDAGALTSDERNAFEAWRSADPRHAAAYARLSAVWRRLDRVQALRPPSSDGVDEAFVLARAATASKPRLERRSGSRAGSFAIRRMRVAAALVLAIAVAWLVGGQLSGEVYSTSKGGFQRIVLEDQSVVELNTDSRMRVRFEAGVRQIELTRGEATFEVAHDPGRPFIVTAGATAVRAIGTKFNVRRLQQSVEVVVNEGRVVVGDPDVVEAQVLTSLPLVPAGYAAIARIGGVEVREISPETAARKLAWHERMLVFEGEPLAEVIAEFNRYNERQLVIDDPTLAGLKIGGYFRPTSLDAFVGVLERSFGIRVATEGERLMLASTGSTGERSAGAAPDR